jgi:hypothetical protein
MILVFLVRYRESKEGKFLPRIGHEEPERE